MGGGAGCTSLSVAVWQRLLTVAMTSIQSRYSSWRLQLRPFHDKERVARPAIRRASASRWSRILSPMLLAPSAVAIFIFVYGFIGYTFYVSLTNWKSAKPDMSIRRPIGAIYGELFGQTRFQIDIRNTVVFTVALSASWRCSAVWAWRSCSTAT